MTYIELEMEWVVACEEAKVRIEELNHLLGDV